jgi:cytochrome c-type biogenesis protein CcmH
MIRGPRLLSPLLLALAAALSQVAFAADAVSTEMDPLKAARAVKLADKLRCLVCQNQTIADSNAELANDLRGQIRELIAAGKSDDEILKYMSTRYGDFVLYDPPFKPTTTLLWAGPALLVFVGAAILIRNVRRRQTAEAPPLTDDEHERAAQLLGGETRKVDS